MTKTFEHKDEHAEAVHTPKPPRGRRVIRFVAGVAAVGVIVVLVPTSIALGYDRYFAGRIFPSVRSEAGQLSGLTMDEARTLITKRVNELLDGGIVFSLNSVRYTISKTSIDANQYLRFDIEAAVKDAYQQGREGNFLERSIARYRLMLGGHETTIPFEMDEQSVTELVAKHFATDVKPAVDAQPSITIDGSGEIHSIGIAPAATGAAPRFVDAVRELHTSLERFENPTTTVKVDIIEPAIHVADAEPHISELSTLLEPLEIRVVHDETSWVLTRRDIAKALAIQKTDDGYQAGIDTSKLKTFFKPIRKVAEVPAVNAIFTMKEDAVVEFTPHKTGIGIDEVTFANTLRDALYQKKAGIELPLMPTDPEITTEKSNTLGIKEALGTGTSSFKGSPKNRVLNIKNGAKKLNFSLVAPDEEFSLIKVLKPFNEKGGYLPELVIKGKKLEPEIGGGLCQIGTTTFRATMNSGLPITERRNHSLVVSYYNDPENGLPGSDATIYDPSPDFKFKNDTGHYILIVADVTAKSGLRFTFWGTSDGRKGSYEAPKVSKWTPVPKEAGTLYLESTSVKTGEQKCKAGFPGAIASLDYTVEKPDGEKKVETFTSIYRMLPPVCLVAKGEIPKEDPTIVPASPGADVPVSASDTGATTQ